MRSRSREINIFSMSALDLFASAMGAFILITVVLFPFFPHTGDSPERVTALKEKISGLEGQLDDANKKMRDMQGEIDGLKKAVADAARLRPKPIDLVVCLDVTGSMGPQIDDIKKEIGQLVRLLSAIAPSVGVGMVAFGDRRWTSAPMLTVLELSELARNPASKAQLQRFVDRLRPAMGTAQGENPDQEEAVGAALSKAVGMRWRPESRRRMIVVITDNAGYMEEWDSIFRAARTFSSSGEEQRVSTVFVNSGRDTGPRAREFLQKLATEGKGRLVTSTGSITGDILDSML
jgi:hypothetical protein